LSSEQLDRPLIIKWPTMATVLDALNRGKEASLSDKGRYEKWMADESGGIAELGRFLTDPVTRVLLDAFRAPQRGARHPNGGRQAFLTLAEMAAALDEARGDGRLARRVRGSPPSSTVAAEWVSAAMDRRMVEGGIDVKCHECLADEILRFGSFSRTFICPRCGLEQRSPAVPDFGYQLSRVAHLFFEHNGDVPALTLSALARRAKTSYWCDFEHRLVPARSSPGASSELDICVVIDGSLVIGEAKKDAAFLGPDISRLRKAALAMRAGYVVLSSGRECDGGCTDRCIPRDQALTFSSDTSLASGVNGPRERMEALRAELSPKGCFVTALCRRQLYGPFQ
jgi:hypothetical protein